MFSSVPPLPKRPDPPAPAEKASPWGIAVAFIACAAAYVGLTFLTLGFFGPVLIIGGVVFGIVAFHYFVWGWWLGKVIREARDDEEQDPVIGKKFSEDE